MNVVLARTNVPVDLQHLVEPEFFGDAFELIVVCRVPDGSVAFGIGNKLRIVGPSALIRSAGMMLFVETRRTSRVRIARKALGGQQWILDPDPVAVGAHGLREIAGSLERRRHRAVLEAGRIVSRQDVLRPEEEQPVTDS